MSKKTTRRLPALTVDNLVAHGALVAPLILTTYVQGRRLVVSVNGQAGCLKRWFVVLPKDAAASTHGRTRLGAPKIARRS